MESEDGVLKSWAVPKGPSINPKIKRLAVMVEDHPFDYLHFEGTIPKGNYGAGTVIVWDTGSYSSREPVLKQIDEGKVTVELYGNKLKGLFKLVKTRKENQWLLIKAQDKFASEDDLTVLSPESVLSSKTNADMESEPEAILGSKSKFSKKSNSTSKKARREEYASHDLFPKIKPMLAHPFEKAFDNEQWVFEVKWDGVRALLFKKDREIKIQSRNGNNITPQYPEIVTAAKLSLRECDSAIIDGEIVVLNEDGIPDFHTHQHRMHIQSTQEIMAMSVEHPSTYYVFDILYKDDHNVEGLGYLERRELLSSNLKTNDTIKISEFIEEKGTAILASSKKLKLEGIVAKHKSSIYREGIRSRDWLKIKNTKTQDCVIIGYTEGLGSRVKHFGSLVLAVYSANEKKLKFAGHAGTGFNDETLSEIYSKLKGLKIKSMPIDKIPYLNRETTWLEPVLVAEVKFDDWTADGILRAPVFLRLREDKKPQECVIEADKPIKAFSQVGNDPKNIPGNIKPNNKSQNKSNVALTLTNTSKVFWKATKEHRAFLKGDLIEYYDKISETILRHLEDRPLSLSRYPNGISGKFFYQKDWDQKKPDFVTTAKIHSEHRGESINYIICNNRETLLWVANLGCIEMHPWYSRINDFGSCNGSTKLYEEKCGLNFPDFILFDLDPYIYSGKEKKGAEPQYNIAGFKAAVDIAHELQDIFKDLKIKSYVKTSGKSGIHIYVPVANIYTYEQTKSFAETIAKIMANKLPQKVTLEWSTSKRKDKVFFDYNQNARGKTIASVYSLRPTVDANVSMPVDWKNIDEILPTDFTIMNVPDIIRKKDAWQGIFSDKQDIGKLISQVEQIS